SRIVLPPVHDEQSVDFFGRIFRCTGIRLCEIPSIYSFCNLVFWFTACFDQAGGLVGKGYRTYGTEKLYPYFETVCELSAGIGYLFVSLWSRLFALLCIGVAVAVCRGQYGNYFL